VNFIDTSVLRWRAARGQRSAHRPYIIGETLALGFDIISQDVPGGATNVVGDQIDQYPLRVQIKRVNA
jgi:hypothetical protein